MDLKFIKTTKCPICGCDTIVQEYIRPDIGRTQLLKHCMGGLWEERTFLCGTVMAYEPSYGKEVRRGECINDPVLIEQKKKRECAERAIADFISGLDCADEDKEKFLRRLKGY